VKYEQISHSLYISKEQNTNHYSVRQNKTVS